MVDINGTELSSVVSLAGPVEYILKRDIEISRHAGLQEESTQLALESCCVLH